MDKLIPVMKKILADSYAVYLKTQNYHWNITSKHAFFSLHKMFEEQYEELADAVDDIAEKIRQLGSKAPASFQTFAKLTTISDGNEDFSADEMIKDLVSDQQNLLNIINQGIKTSYNDSDEGTADLLIERLRVHEKNKWMLESSL